MDERKTSYDTVVCRFGKYLRNFQTYCSEDKEEIKALSERNKSNKKKKVVINTEDEESKHLPELQILKRY